MIEEGGESEKASEERVYERKRGKESEGKRACGTPSGEHSGRVKMRVGICTLIAPARTSPMARAERGAARQHRS